MSFLEALGSVFANPALAARPKGMRTRGIVIAPPWAKDQLWAWAPHYSFPVGLPALAELAGEWETPLVTEVRREWNDAHAQEKGRKKP